MIVPPNPDQIAVNIENRRMGQPRSSKREPAQRWRMGQASNCTPASTMYNMGRRGSHTSNQGCRNSLTGPFDGGAVRNHAEANANKMTAKAAKINTRFARFGSSSLDTLQ